MRRGTNFLLISAVVVTFLTGFEGIADAQYSCTANAAVPPTLRSDGLAELVGDLVLICNGGLPAGATANLTVFFNTAITSKLLSATTSEALLLINDPPPASQVLNTNVFEGTVAGNSVTWVGIPLPPGPNGLIRMTNVRANASAIALVPTPGQVVSLISASGPISVPINNPTQLVSFVQQGKDFSVMGANFNQSFPPGASGNPTGFTMTFHESFPTSFKERIQGTDQNMTGFIYNTENGFTSTATGAAGRASHGTRLMARFSSVQNGVNLFVPTNVTGSAGSTAVLVSVTDPTGATGDPGAPIPPPGQVILAAGTGTATWEVTSDNPLASEDFAIAVTVDYTPNLGLGLPGLGTAMVDGVLAPISTVVQSSLTEPVPRFADVPITRTAFTISAQVVATPVPTMTEWGMIMLTVFLGMVSLYYLRRRRAAI